MKKLNELKSLHDTFVDSLNDLDLKILNQMKKIKKEYQQIVIDEKIKLLITVCEGENLDFNKIKSKYLKSKELLLLVDTPIIKEDVIDDDVLNTIQINDKIYYYQPKEKGIVYDSTSKQVGEFKNGNVILN